jgi:hypothetical protein
MKGVTKEHNVYRSTACASCRVINCVNFTGNRAGIVSISPAILHVAPGIVLLALATLQNK